MLLLYVVFTQDLLKVNRLCRACICGPLVGVFASKLSAGGVFLIGLSGTFAGSPCCCDDPVRGANWYGLHKCF